tara:strand:+ start:261 stop:1352 length:1092 start_codon:yes stop_codon:yes gene_type:complete
MVITTNVKVIESKSKKNLAPITAKWKGVPYIRSHSFLATVREVISFSAEIDVCRIGLIGSMHSGKSTLSQSIAHAIHKFADIPYKIKILYKEDLLNFEKTLLALEPVNYILIFDDVSFMGATANKKQIEMVKSAVTTIRHLDGGRDVKIIVMMNYHYSMGLDKYLRSADFKYITTVDSSENENMEKMFGTKNGWKIKQFKKYRHNAVTLKSWFIPLAKDKPKFKYDYRKPFIPVLFWNEASLRLIIAPTRQWQDPICSKCSVATGGGNLESAVPIAQFCEESENKIGKGVWLAGVKLSMYVEGLTVYNKNVINAVKYLAKCRAKKLITLEQIAGHYDFVPKHTRVRKKMDGVMLDDKEKTDAD